MILIATNKYFKFNIDTISLLPENLSVIYAIHCTRHKSYIGQTFNLKVRLKTHYGQLSTLKHYNSTLQNAWNNYSCEDFEFEILEIIEQPTRGKLCTAENFWIELYKNESKILFNILTENNSESNIRTIQFSLTQEEYKSLTEYAFCLQRTPANLVKHWVLTAMIGKGLIKNRTLEDLRNEKS